MKLIFIDRGERNFDIFFSDRLRRQPYVIPTPEINVERNVDNARTACLFAPQDETELDVLMEELAKKNPGCEVRLFELIESGVCPPAEMVKKRVTKDGVLPV